MPVDVTGIGLITKNKVISSEGAVHGKCNDEIEKKTDNYFTSVDNNIFGNNIFCNRTLTFRDVSGAPPLRLHILFDSDKVEHDGATVMTMTGFHKHMESIRSETFLKAEY